MVGTFPVEQVPYVVAGLCVAFFGMGVLFTVLVQDVKAFVKLLKK